MKILLISDTHRYLKKFQTVLERIPAIDYILHMGDAEGDEDVIRELAGCPVDFVAGNNDYLSSHEREKELEIGGIRIFMTHGHYYGVSMGLNRLAEEGAARGVRVVLFGHTHRPTIEYRQNLTLVNPGSLSYPRQPGRQPSFGIMEIDSKKDLHFTINYLD